MKRSHYIFLLLATLFIVTGCREDDDHEPRSLGYCLSMPWHNGRGETRAASLSGDIFGNPMGKWVDIANYGYPQTVSVHCSDGNDFELTATDDPVRMCDDHHEFGAYASSRDYRDLQVKEGLTFTATATIDVPATGGDDLYAEESDVQLAGMHLQFTMHHRKALVRFCFRLSDRYDKVRQILLTQVVLNGKQVHLHNLPLLHTQAYLEAGGLSREKMSYAALAYCYLDPADLNVGDNNAIECTYNIYEKDETFTPTSWAGTDPAEEWNVNDPYFSTKASKEHLTREAVIARNSFRFNSFKDLSGNSLSALKAGYYYDLNVTINPDYLYVLADHDNKHMTIN